MAFGKYLRREREGLDMTLTELAQWIEVSIAYLSRIERERENPPPDRLVSALARARVPTNESRLPRRPFRCSGRLTHGAMCSAEPKPVNPNPPQ